MRARRQKSEKAKAKEAVESLFWFGVKSVSELSGKGLVDGGQEAKRHPIEWHIVQSSGTWHLHGVDPVDRDLVRRPMEYSVIAAFCIPGCVCVTRGVESGDR